VLIYNHQITVVDAIHSEGTITIVPFEYNINILGGNIMALEFKGKEAEVVETKEAPVAENAVYGTARKDLAFVCPLGDPSNPDTTKVKLPDGGEDKKVTSTIVGYRFKVLADMKVPDCGTNDGLKGDLMNYDNVDNWRDAKKGEEIDLTPFETALLLSQPQFNGGCEGGEKPVSCVYQNKFLKNKDGAVEKASAAASTPRVSLRATTGSIKDFDIIDVLTFTRKEDENGRVRKDRVINPGFEKWAPLAAAKVRKSAGGRAKAEADPTKVANANAQAFLNFVNSRKVAK
jgi:hypothetical protein